MTAEDKKESFAGDLMSVWLETAQQFWEAAGGLTGVDQKTQNADDNSDSKSSSRTQESLEAVMKSWKTATEMAKDPDIAERLSKGFKTTPDLLLRMAESGWDTYFKLQQQWVEKMGRIQGSSKAYQFDHLDQETFQAWTDIYTKELSPFLKMPKVGLARFYQERVDDAVDKFNCLQMEIGELLYLLMLPFEKSIYALQEQLGQMAQAGELPEDSKAYYQQWIKVLEGHYMKLYQSENYAQVMGRTLGAMENFKQAKDAVLMDLIKNLPVPTQNEMDELYKDLYTLKRRVRTLEKELERVNR